MIECRPANIAYLISAHADAPQLRRLVEVLREDAHVFVHIDRKSDIEPFVSGIDHSNVHFLDDRVDVRWGTILEVDYQMALIKAAVDHPVEFDKIFFLSGMDYPLWSNKRIREWADTHGGEYLCGICMDSKEIDKRQRRLYQTSRPFFSIETLGNKGNQRLSIVCRKLKALLGMRKRLYFKVDGKLWRLYKGSAWWCVSQKLACYIYDMYMQYPEIRKYFVDSFGQAETVAQTIAFNSRQWAKECMLVEGKYPGLAALTPLHYIVYDPVIKVMDETDYDALMASGRMFARKFVSGKSDKLIEKLHGRE